MKLSKLMKGRALNPNFEGVVTNDDMVLAVDISGQEGTDPNDYVVVQMGIDGLDAQNNPVTVDKQYIRAGQSTTKTGSQRSFKISGAVGSRFLVPRRCFARKKAPRPIGMFLFRYDLVVWFVLRGSMGRQGSSGSQALSRKDFFCGAQCSLAAFCASISPPTVSFRT